MKDNIYKEAIKWLRQAQVELEDATKLKEMGRYYLSLFLCQQSAEKALKSYVYFKEYEPIYTHSVSRLLEIAIEIDGGFKSIRPSGRLDDYYIPTRYPNGVPDNIPADYYNDPEEAGRAIQLCGDVLELVKKKITS